MGYFRPWMFILTDGMTADSPDLPATARQVRNIAVAKGVTTFAIMSGAAGYDGAREQMRPLTDRTLQMGEASYDALLEWMANSTVARSNSNAGERSRMEDPTAWLEVETETKSQNGSSSPPGWWEPSTPGATRPIRMPCST